MQSTNLNIFRQARYFPALDGLRAISVLLVMLVHLKDKTFILKHVPGWIGVDIFFVLSGFLITTLLLREQEQSGSVSYRAFYVRRVFRILPIYLLILLVYCGVCYFVRHGATWQEFRSGLPYYAVFLNEFAKPEIPFSYSWTLGIEEKFYVLWPCIAFALCHSLRARVWTCFILAIACLFLPFQLGRSYLGLLLGATLALTLAWEGASRLANLAQRTPIYVPLSAVIISLGLVDYSARFVPLFDGAIAALIIHLLLAPSRIRLLLEHRILTWFGKRSYSMYLVHLLVLNFIVAAARPQTTFSQLVVLLIAYLAASIVANVLYVSVEEPARKLGRRLVAPATKSIAAEAR